MARNKPYHHKMPHRHPAGHQWTTEQLTRNFQAIDAWQTQETSGARALRLLHAWGYPNVSAPTWGPGAAGEQTLYSFTVDGREFMNNGGWWVTAGGLCSIAGANLPFSLNLNGTPYIQLIPTTASGNYWIIQAMLVNYWTTNGSYWANFQHGSAAYPTTSVSAPASPATSSPITVSLTATMGASDTMEFYGLTFTLLPPLLNLT